MISDDQLNCFVGEWQGSEQLHATAWTEAGKAHGAFSIAAGPRGLLVDYREHRDGAEMIGHGVLCGEHWWWFDSYGFTPVEPGVARLRDAELSLERRSERGRTVTTLRVRDDVLEQRVDTAVPADAPLVPMLRGTYRRRGDAGRDPEPRVGEPR
jgi:hypothetical protein